MKSIHIFLFLFSLVYIHSESCESTKNPSSAKDCQNKEISSSASYCCYIKIKHSTGEINYCVALTQNLYNNIKSTKNGYEFLYNLVYTDCKVKKLDCKSSYLKFSLFSLILLLL